MPHIDELKKHMEAEGITQADLARITRKSKQYISHLMTGHRSMTAKTAEEISDALGMEWRLVKKAMAER